MVITGLTRNQLYLTVPWVRIPPLPPIKIRDAAGIFYFYSSKPRMMNPSNCEAICCVCAKINKRSQKAPAQTWVLESHRFRQLTAILVKRSCGFILLFSCWISSPQSLRSPKTRLYLAKRRAGAPRSNEACSCGMRDRPLLPRRRHRTSLSAT